MAFVVAGVLPRSGGREEDDVIKAMFNGNFYENRFIVGKSRFDPADVPATCFAEGVSFATFDVRKFLQECGEGGSPND